MTSIIEKAKNMISGTKAVDTPMTAYVETPAEAFSLTLGAVYRDVVTGYRGRATSYCEFLSGCVQYGLIPVVTDEATKPGEGAFFDYQRLVRDDTVPAIVIKNPLPAPLRSFKMGSKVRDIVTGVEGIIINKAARIIGEVTYTIQPEGTNKDGDVREAMYLEWSRLEEIAPPVAEVEKVVENVKPHRPGGPSRRSELPSRM